MPEKSVRRLLQVHTLDNKCVAQYVVGMYGPAALLPVVRGILTVVHTDRRLLAFNIGRLFGGYEHGVRNNIGPVLNEHYTVTDLSDEYMLTLSELQS